jgi:hypothetical protein
MIIGFLGKAGVGKDTAADYLCLNYGFTRVAFADPLKRFCMEVFDWTEEQLWGPSEMRNKPDERYLQAMVYPASRAVEKSTSIKQVERVPRYLSPRYALQTLGTEWGRGCYENIWVDYALRAAKKLMEGQGLYWYYPTEGVVLREDYRRVEVKGVVISDVRFKNEVTRIREKGAKVFRLVRRRAGDLEAGIIGHASETEQDSILDSDLDGVIQVPEGIDKFALELDSLMTSLHGP